MLPADLLAWKDRTGHLLVQDWTHGSQSLFAKKCLAQRPLLFVFFFLTKEKINIFAAEKGWKIFGIFFFFPMER